MLGVNHNNEVFGVRSNLSGNHRGKERERKEHNQMQKNIREKLKSVMNLHSRKSGRKNRSLLAYTLWGKKHQGNIKGFFPFEAVS